MAMAPRHSSFVSRRGVLAGGAALVAGPAWAARPKRIAMLGDSITAGYGLSPAQALPARLKAELARLGWAVEVLAAGRNGDTTGGGAARVDRATPPGVSLCVVALGANDLLNGADPATVGANLDRILTRLRQRKVAAVLAGVRAPPIFDPAYARRFNAAFAGAARRHGAGFLPDLLAGVLLNPDLNQRDGIHPNAAGVQVIARNLAPVVARSLKRLG